MKARGRRPRITTRKTIQTYDVIDALCSLRADPILIQAALHGKITKLECRFVDEGRCLHPTDPTFFTCKGSPRNNPWAPSADRWPVPGREGGEYTIENVRLTHYRCNVAEGGRIGGPMGDHVPCGRASGGKNFTHEGSVRGGRTSGRMSKGNKSFGRNVQARWRGTPEQQEWLSRAGRLGGKAVHKKYAGTPEYHERQSHAGRAPRKQVTCECGMVSNPGPMTGHFKATGHRRVEP